MIDFEATYKENYPKMFCIAKKMVSDEDVVCDIVQEVFVYCYEKTQNGAVIHSPQNWLVRATINKCIDYLNRKKKHARLDAVERFEAGEASTDEPSDVAILSEALAELKPREMKLVMLYGEGYSYKEIAQMADIHFSSVGKILSRALERLKEEIVKRKNHEISMFKK